MKFMKVIMHIYFLIQIMNGNLAVEDIILKMNGQKIILNKNYIVHLVFQLMKKKLNLM